MKRPRRRPWPWTFLQGGLACLGLVAVLALPTLASFPPAPDDGKAPMGTPAGERASDEPDPLPIRRLLLPADALLRRPDRKELRQLTHADFEALVRAAQDGLKRKEKLPHLLTARYRARLTGEALTGTAQWRVLHPGPEPALLNLEADGQTFNLALGRPRFENRDAPVARFDGKDLALLIDMPGQHVVALEWSAQGEARPEGLRFGLQVPRCPVASLELDLPADRTVTDLGGSVLSGPHPAEDPQRRLWKILFSGRSRVDLLVRRSPPGRGDPAGAAPLLLSQLKTVQELGPDGQEVTFALSLEAVHRGVRELTCTCSPGLKPQEIDVPHLERWDFVPGGPGRPGRLTVRLKRPLYDGLLHIRCLAPLGSPAPPERGPPQADREAGRVRWESPTVRVAGAIPQGETLEVVLDPDLRWEDWDPGDFRLVEAGQVPPERPTDPAQPADPPSYRLRLEGGAVQLGKAPRRPAATITTSGVDYRARQLAWWRTGPRGMALTLQIDYEVHHGRLFRLPVLLPDGWEVGTVKVRPGGLLHNLVIQQEPPPGKPRGKKAAILVVELDRPLQASPAPGRNPGEAPGPRHPSPPAPAELSRLVPSLEPGPQAPLSGLRLTVELRPAGGASPSRPGSQPASPQDGPLGPLPFPGAVPLGARFLEGGLGITFDPRVHRAEVEAAPVHPTREAVPTDGPWGESTPELYYPFFDTRRHPAMGPLFPRARLTLHPRPVRLRAHCHSEVIASPDRALVQAQVTLEATTGSPRSVDLFFSGEDTGEIIAHSERTQVARVERLPSREVADFLELLAAGHAPGLAALEAARPRGSYWRVHLRRPLPPGTPLTLSVTRDLVNRAGGGSAFLWHVPLPAVVGAASVQGDVALRLSGMGPADVETLGLREGPSTGRTRQAGPPGRTFHYDGRWFALTLSGQGTRLPRDPETIRVDQALLSTSLGPGQVLRHAFRFRVTGWSAPTLPLRLPAGARLLAVRLDGTWLARPRILNPEGGDGPGANPSPAGDKVEIALPVPDRKEGRAGSARTYEILYVTEVPAWTLWQDLRAPAPVLPVAPLALRRVWHLPPEVRPLSPDRFRRLPGGPAFPTTGQAGEQGRDWPGDLFRLVPLFTQPVTPGTAQPDAALPSILTEALTEEVARRGAAEEGGDGVAGRPKGVTLREWLHHLVDRLPGYVLLADCPALRRAGLSLDRALPDGEPSASLAGTGRLAFLVARLSSREEGATVGSSARNVPFLLITTRDAFPSAPTAKPSSPSLARALALAARHGHEPAGRFWLVADWLWQPHLDGPKKEEDLFPPSSFLLPPSDWTAWEPVPGPDPDAAFLVVRRDVVAAAGLVLAAVLLLVLWLGRRAPRFRGTLLVCWLGLAGVGLFWLPPALQDLAWWPGLLGCAVAPLVCLPLLWRAPQPTPPAQESGSGAPDRGSSPPPSGARPETPAALAGLLLVCCLGPALVGQEASEPPPPANPPRSPMDTVYLLPGEGGKRHVLAPPALLDRLAELARPDLLGAHLVAAEYEGQLVDGAAEFAATFRIHHAEDAPAEVAIPLGGVALAGSVWLDGARARVKPRPRPQEGYTVTVTGRGAHRLQLRFRVPVRQVEGSHRLWFSAPPLAENTLRLTLPAGASHAHVVGALGKQGVTPGKKGEGPVLQADLGPLRAQTLVYWHLPVPGARPPRVRHASAYLWDLRPGDGSLTAFVRYEVSGGTVSSLAVDLPDGLEVRRCFAIGRPEGTFPDARAEVGPAPRGAKGPAARDRPEGMPSPGGYRLRDWHVARSEGGRKVHLYFERPVSGIFDVTLKLCRREPLSAVIDLFPLPVPEGEGVAGASHLAYRTRGLEARPRQGKLLRVTGIKRENFAPFWEGPSRPDTGSLEYACALPARHASGAAKPARDPEPTLQLRLALAQPGLMRARQEVNVRVEATHAEVDVNARLEGDGEGMSLVEWRLQPAGNLEISEVEGPEVYCWAQTGDRLQVWLRQAVRETSLRLSGRQRLAKLPGEHPGRLAIPSFRPVLIANHAPRAGSADLVETILRIETHEGLALAPGRAQHLDPSPDAGQPSGRSLRYRTRSPGYGGTVQILREAEWQVRSWVAAGWPGGPGGDSHRPTFVAAVECRPAPSSPGSPTGLRIHLDKRAGTPVTLEGEAVARKVVRSDPDGQTWEVGLKPGTGGPVVLVLRGSLAGAEGTPMWALPRVRVSGAVQTERWVAAGRGLQVGEATGLEPVLSAPEWVTRLRVVPKPEQAWKVAGENGGLKVAPAPSEDTPRVRIHLAEARATLADGKRWLHRMEYRLGHEAGTDLDVTLPAEAQVVAAAVDGRAVHPSQAGRQVWVPLPDTAGLRRVWLCWRFEQGERLDRPNLDKPLVGSTGPGGKASDDYPVLWTIDVPAGWSPRDPSAAGPAEWLGTGWARLAAVELHRAEAELRAARASTPGPREDPGAERAEARRRFARHCRRAEQALSRLAVAGKGGPDDPGGEVHRLQEWLSALQAEGREPAREPGGRPEAEAAGERLATEPDLEGLFGEKDLPYLWYTSPEAPAPRVELKAESAGRASRALGGSVLWLGFIGGLGFLAASPRRRAWARAFWPELLLVLGGVGWILAGLTPLVVVLLLAGAGVRAFRLIRDVQGWFSRPAAPPPGAQGSEAGG